MPAFGIFDELEVDPLRPLPWLRLRTRGGRVLPLRLVDSVPRAEAVGTEADESLSPWLLLSGEVGSGLAAAGDTSISLLGLLLHAGRVGIAGSGCARGWIPSGWR